MLTMSNHKAPASNRSSPNPNASFGVMIQIIPLELCFAICCRLETCERSKIAIIVAEGIHVFSYKSRHDHQRSDARNIPTKEPPYSCVYCVPACSSPLPHQQLVISCLARYPTTLRHTEAFSIPNWIAHRDTPVLFDPRDRVSSRRLFGYQE